LAIETNVELASKVANRKALSFKGLGGFWSLMKIIQQNRVTH
jgi:hypothetical protein